MQPAEPRSARLACVGAAGGHRNAEAAPPAACAPDRLPNHIPSRREPVYSETRQARMRHGLRSATREHACEAVVFGCSHSSIWRATTRGLDNNRGAGGRAARRRDSSPEDRPRREPGRGRRRDQAKRDFGSLYVDAANMPSGAERTDRQHVPTQIIFVTMHFSAVWTQRTVMARQEPSPAR
jgi:hypothetical protein